MGNILPASREITPGNRYKNKNVSINKQIRNVQLVVYFILRNLNDKSSLIIYHCPYKSTMNIAFQC
jgi:hypothetical protein